MRKLLEHGPCFICGTSNPDSMGVTWWADAAGCIHTTITLSVAQQGPPGYVHGGASAALLDEVMGMAVWNAGYQVASVNLECEYRRPLPLGTELHVMGEIVEKTGSAIRARGTITLPDGTQAVIGRGIYVEAPHLFEHIMGAPTRSEAEQRPDPSEAADRRA
ncbi:MAG TPA: PaaI family thioesterase [Herpetosiphonaceae bacterium]